MNKKTMISKTIYLLAGLFMCCRVSVTTAQTFKNEVQVIEGAYSIEKKRIIDEAMKLSGEEALRFWPIYDEYENKRSTLNKMRLYLIYDYMAAYPVLSDKKALEITDRYFENDKAVARLHRKYYKKVKKALSPLKAAQFVQVEGYLENSVRMQLQCRLPFIGDKIPMIDNIDERGIKHNGTM